MNDPTPARTQSDQIRRRKLEWVVELDRSPHFAMFVKEIERRHDEYLAQALDPATEDTKAARVCRKELADLVKFIPEELARLTREMRA